MTGSADLGTPIASDHELAAAIADDAGRLLVALRAAGDGGDPGALRDAGDRQSHDRIMSWLAAQRPADAVLSEEGRDDPARLAARRVWIVDPLDGTREFGEPGREDWAVHVALVEDGVPVAGAVALPAQGRVLGTAPAPATPDPGPGRIRLVVSRSHTPPEAVTLAERLDAQLVYMGSAGAKTMAVVLGEADAYVHLGGQYEWDSAAPIAVATAAGLRTSRVDGSPIRYNRADPWLPDQVVCRADLHAPILAALAAL